MDIDTEFLFGTPASRDSKAFLPTNVPFDQSYMSIAKDLASPYQDFAADLGYGGDPTKIQGIGSDVRHTAGSALGKFAVQDYLAENLAIPRDSRLSNILGDAAIVASTIGQEIPDAIKNIPEAGINFYKQPFEDIRANFQAVGIPYGTSNKDLIEYAIAQSPSRDMIEEAKALTTGESQTFPRFPTMIRSPLRDTNYKYGTVKADDIPLFEGRDFSEFDQAKMGGTRQPSSFRSLNDPEVYGELEEEKSLLEKILELGKGLGGGIVDAARGAGSAISNLGIIGALRGLDQFKNLSLSDQNFILSQAGGNRPAKDRFGYNIRSAFGNYATLVGNRADIAKDRLARGLPLRAIDQYYLNKEKERAAAAKADFDRLNAIRQQRDADSMSGGAGETTSGTFGSSVNDPSTFSDYS